MSLLSPLGLLWLASIPLLLWLWRLASSHRKIRVASLAPFEHLIRRTSRRRTRLVINALFWLQLLALILLALALAAPILYRQRAQTILVIMDTSASMGARWRGESLLEHARRRVLDRLARKGRADEVFVVTSAPVGALAEQPQQDLAEVRRALGELRASHLTGNLATATHIGRALLGGVVDLTLVVTDEPAPQVLPPDVEFLEVGDALPNLAIVGFNAHGGFCSDVPARLVVTLQSFSERGSTARVRVRQAERVVAEASASLDAGERVNMSLPMPDGSEGWMEVELATDADALAVDNRAQILLRRASTLPVAVVSDHDEFRDAAGEWLGACQGLVWTDEPLPPQAPSHVVVTDGPVPAGQRVAGILQWMTRQPAPQARLAHWMVDPSHPIGSYLGPVEVVSASIEGDPAAVFSGEPVVWGLADGERTPLVLVGEQDGRRRVSVLIDLVASPDSVPLLTIFFNSLRWLMGQADIVRTGEPLRVSSLERGPVTVHRPDGAVERLHHEGGVFLYDGTTQVGPYRITQGDTEVTWVANFLDPLESDLIDRTSTWHPIDTGPPASPEDLRTPYPLAKTLAMLILALLLFEWWLYSRRRA